MCVYIYACIHGKGPLEKFFAYTTRDDEFEGGKMEWAIKLLRTPRKFIYLRKK